jgi:hypothetical protein
MVPFPANNLDVLDLADWMELYALDSGDKNSSAGDLQRELVKLHNFDVAEEKAAEVVRELELRELSAGDAYPFELMFGRVLQARDGWEDRVGYLFCLCLSYFGWKIVAGAPVNPWFLFEDLSAVAAREYVNGEVLQFGTRHARVDDASFAAAVNQLCVRFGEGQGFRPRPGARPQDDKVDLIAWRHFPDQLSSKLVIFGQCAAGSNFKTKVSELDPDAFWKLWVSEAPVTNPLAKSFFIPHRLTSEEWEYVATYAGILFDRCRIAYWAWRDNRAVRADQRYTQWLRTVLPTLPI